MIKKSVTTAIALAALAFAGIASAVTVTFDPPTSTPAAGGTVSGIDIVSSDTTGARGWSASFTVPVGLTVANETVVNNTSSGAAGALGTCAYDSGTRILSVFTGNLSATEIPAGTVCTFDLVVDAGVANGTALAIEPSNTQCTALAGTCTTTVTDVDAGTAGTQAHVATIQGVTGPMIVAGSPAFGSTTAVAGGTVGGAAVTQDITFGASTGGSGGGTTDLVCVDDDAGTTLSNATQNDIADGQTPATITASFTPGAARTVTVSCTATREGAANQTFSYTFDVAAASPATGPTLTPPASTSVTVSGGLIGSEGTASIRFSASGGDAGQTSTLSCTANAPVSIVSGGNQTVTTGTQPDPVVVAITLTDAPQSGTVVCNGTTFTVSAGAGATFVRPEVIPSASTWSKIALFGLLGVFGMMAVGFRRHG